MILVPTYNGHYQLANLIKALETHGTSGHKVLIIDNGTNDLVSKKYLEMLSSYNGKLDLIIEKNKHGKYETGAWIHATREHPEEERFILIHDGCTPLSDQWLAQFESNLSPSNGAVSWIRFKPCLFHMFDCHFEYMDKICPHDNVPDGGIFGNIFMTYSSILRDWDSRGFFDNPPTEKIHAEAWERIWAILFHLDGYNIHNIIDEFNPTAIHYGQYPHLKKSFNNRL